MTANSDILVHIETRNGAVQPVSLELLTAARELAGALGKKVEALVAAAAPQQIAGQLGAADRVLTVSHPALERYTPEAYGAVLAETVRQRGPAVVLLGYSSVGLDLAPNLAVRTGRPLVSYCVKLAIAGDAIEADSIIYGGKLRATTKVTLPAIFTVTPGSYAEAQTGTSPAETEDLVPPEAIAALRTVFVSETKPPPDAIDLAQAERVLCVGRGISNKDSIALAEEVASALGAEIAGSRPVIDAGWLPKERQVGKSGTKVKPKLYIAAGVSGAPEHLEGMSTAELIVAINSDAKAPIFGIAHYGTTCDLFDLLPALGERLKSTRSG
jgi:electron transfer flavoprotein alpha subunit